MCAAGPSAPCARDLLVSFTPACLWSRVNQALHPDCAEAAWGRGRGGRCSDAGGRRPARDHRLWSPQQQPCGQRRLPLPAHCCLTHSCLLCFSGWAVVAGRSQSCWNCGAGRLHEGHAGGLCGCAWAAWGQAVPSCVDMCCLPLGRVGSWQPLHVWCREALGLAPGPVRGLCPPQTATALPLHLGEVSWAHCQRTACAARGRLLLGCTEPAPQQETTACPAAPQQGPRKNGRGGILRGAGRRWPAQPSLSAGATSPPSGPGTAPHLGAPSPFHVFSRAWPLPKHPLALALSCGCAPPPTKLQRPHSGGAGPWG